MAAPEVLHLPDLDVRMLHGQPLHGREGQAITPPGRPEHPLAELVQLQVGHDPLEVQVVFGLAQLLDVEAVVPGGQLEASAFSGVPAMDFSTAQWA